MLNTIKTENGIPEREEIEQVRRLLFGEMQEANQRRMDALEASLQDTRAALERQIAALGSATSVSQANLIKEIGSAISGLGHKIAALADGAAPEAASAEPAAVETEPQVVPEYTPAETTEAANTASADAGAQDHE